MEGIRVKGEVWSVVEEKQIGPILCWSLNAVLEIFIVTLRQLDIIECF